MFGALFFLFLFRAAATQQTYIVDEECLNYTVYPLQYDIVIKPYVYNGRFFYDCDLTVTVIANVPTNIIEMEAKHLVIHGESVRVFKGSQDIVNRPRPYIHDEERGKLIIYLNEPLVPYKGKNTQQYDIRMSFRKEVKDDSYGVFVVKYFDEHRQARYFVQTRLSPDYAKYFIPCFDNPRFDSKFKFLVHIPPDSGVAYNTSLVIAEQFKKETLPDRTVVIQYEPSPQIYLYQLGFHYSQFSNIRKISRYTNDTIIVWAPAHKIKNCEYVHNFIDLLLEGISRRYSTVKRPLTTGPINIIAVPKDLNGYEVGSWNLLTNNEIRIIHSEEYSSVKQVEQMYFEITQQLIRIWLGNPGEQTRTKWREEWFKDGVATYLTYDLLSQYNYGDDVEGLQRLPLHEFSFRMIHTAMNSDHHQSTPALINFDNEIAVNIPSRYKQLVTMKTASILWMLENYVGPEKFYPALIKYINNRRGMFISLKDFMVSLDQDTVECFAGHNGSRASVVFDSWLRHPGYPVIHVHVFRNRSPNAVQLKQWRFTLSGRREESSYLIPISYVVQNGSNCFNCRQPWFTIDRHSYTFSENLNGGWIILNRNASGYYRVNYDDRTWTMIANTLKNDMSAIGEMNRAQIVNDVFALFVSGDLNQDFAMKILDYLDQERSMIVWEAVNSGYELLKTDNANCGMTKFIYNEWQTFLRKKMVVIYKILSNNNVKKDDLRMRRFKNGIIELACAVGSQKCLEYTQHLYTQWRTKNYRIDPDWRQACYRAAYKTQQSNLDGNIFNAYELDDRKTAMHSVQKEKVFIYKTPIGEPRPENITMTTTELEPEIVSTEKSALKDFGFRLTSGSELILLNLFIFALITFNFS